jgi:hypothetical protein
MAEKSVFKSSATAEPPSEFSSPAAGRSEFFTPAAGHDDIASAVGSCGGSVGKEG